MSNAGAPDDPREILAGVAASLRAYLEVQQETGATGIPRRPKSSASATASASAPLVPAPAAPTLPAPPDPAIEAEQPVPLSAIPPSIGVPAPPPPSKPPTVPSRPLPVIADEVKACTKCGLGATRIQTVFSRGNPEAQLCFVGEAPGADEDEQGAPFVGRAGQLLDKMIVAMGLDPAKDVYVCNIIKCRPPGNRKPEPAEIEACIPYLHEQLAAIKPKAIVALGNTAVGALLGTKLGITKVRGQWKLYRGSIPVMPTYHPSYLLRPSATQAESKKQAWEDLQAVMKELGLAPAKAPKKS